MGIAVYDRRPPTPLVDIDQYQLQKSIPTSGIHLQFSQAIKLFRIFNLIQNVLESTKINKKTGNIHKKTLEHNLYLVKNL